MKRRKCSLQGCNVTFIPTTRGQLCCCASHGGLFKRRTMEVQEYKPGKLQDVPTVMHGVQYEDVGAV